MSPRLKRPRRVLNPPPVKGFKPFGPETGQHSNEPVTLLYEEYEALRLCDYDLLKHEEASDVMGVSRPTFTRIYATARQKIARAFVEGRPIDIEGGKVYFDSTWFECTSCKSFFNNPTMQPEITGCPLCGSQSVSGMSVDQSINTLP